MVTTFLLYTIDGWVRADTLDKVRKRLPEVTVFGKMGDEVGYVIFETPADYEQCGWWKLRSATGTPKLVEAVGPFGDAFKNRSPIDGPDPSLIMKLMMVQAAEWVKQTTH
jgi:hypothetical protein